MTKLPLRAFAGLAVLPVFAACFAPGEFGPYDPAQEIPRTAEGIARELRLDGVAFAPLPISKYTGAHLRSLEIIDGAAYCITDADQVYAVALADGTPLWMLQLDHRPNDRNAIALGADRLGFLSKNHLTVVKKSTGGRLLSVGLHFTPSSAGVLTDHSFYAGAWGEGYRLRSATTVDGWSGWAYEAGGAITARPLLVGSSGADLAIYFADQGGNVVALDPRPANAVAPTPSWTAVTTGAVTAPLAADDRHLFVASQDGVLYAFSRAAGAVRWKWYGEGEPLSAGPVVAHGRIYQPVAGAVVVIDIESGRELHRITGGHEFLCRIGDRDFFRLPDHTIGAFDHATGAETDRVYSPMFQFVIANPAGGELVFSDGKLLCALR
jgi:hypothetical protein